jgi:hypothetical protein
VSFKENVMMTAWREQLFGATVCFASLLLVFASGCQSWSNMSAPMQSATRVPPPGTGSYNLQGAYYNNPATAQSNNLSPTSGNAAPVVQASATSGSFNPAGSNYPTSQFTDSGAVSFASTNAMNAAAFGTASQGVNTAGYTDNGSSGAQVISASSMPTRVSDASNSDSIDTTNLQWK